MLKKLKVVVWFLEFFAEVPRILLWVICLFGILVGGGLILLLSEFLVNHGIGNSLANNMGWIALIVVVFLLLASLLFYWKKDPEDEEDKEKDEEDKATGIAGGASISSSTGDEADSWWAAAKKGAKIRRVHIIAAIVLVIFLLITLWALSPEFLSRLSDTKIFWAFIGIGLVLLTFFSLIKDLPALPKLAGFIILLLGVGVIYASYHALKGMWEHERKVSEGSTWIHGDTTDIQILVTEDGSREIPVPPGYSINWRSLTKGNYAYRAMTPFASADFTQNSKGEKVFDWIPSIKFYSLTSSPVKIGVSIFKTPRNLTKTVPEDPVISVSTPDSALPKEFRITPPDPMNGSSDTTTTTPAADTAGVLHLKNTRVSVF